MHYKNKLFLNICHFHYAFYLHDFPLHTGPLTFLLHGIFIIRSLLILLVIGSLRNIFQVLHGISVYENNSNYEIPVRYGDWLTMFNSTNHTEARLFFRGNVLTDNAILLKRYICWVEWRIILNTSVKNRKLGTVEKLALCHWLKILSDCNRRWLLRTSRQMMDGFLLKWQLCCVSAILIQHKCTGRLLWFFNS